MSRPRLVLADDHPETRALLRGLLDTEFDVVGLVADGPALVRAAQLLTPDVIVTDIGMPGMDGIAAATEVLRTNPGMRVVLTGCSVREPFGSWADTIPQGDPWLARESRSPMKS